MEEIRKQVDAMTLEACRARLVEIREMASRGDYSYSYDEYLLIVQKVPEEKRQLDRTMRQHDAGVLRLRRDARAMRPRSRNKKGM